VDVVQAQGWQGENAERQRQGKEEGKDG
jgi:hypothetical protein